MVASKFAHQKEERKEEEKFKKIHPAKNGHNIHLLMSTKARTSFGQKKSIDFECFTLTLFLKIFTDSSSIFVSSSRKVEKCVISILLFLDYKFDDDFMTFQLAIPDIGSFSSSGGIIAARTSLYVSHKFPLTLGLAVVADINQMSFIKEQYLKYPQV